MEYCPAGIYLNLLFFCQINDLLNKYLYITYLIALTNCYYAMVYVDLVLIEVTSIKIQQPPMNASKSR